MIFRKSRFFQWFLLIKTIETCFDHNFAKSARIRASFGTFFRQSLQMKCTNFGLDRWRFRVQTRFSCRFDFSSPTYVFRVEIVQESKERARRLFFLVFKKCNFWSDWSNFEEVTARPYRGEDVCKSWSELVKISVSYDQNKFQLFLLMKNYILELYHMYQSHCGIQVRNHITSKTVENVLRTVWQASFHQ